MKWSYRSDTLKGGYSSLKNFLRDVYIYEEDDPGAIENDELSMIQASLPGSVLVPEVQRINNEIESGELEEENRYKYYAGAAASELFIRAIECIPAYFFYRSWVEAGEFVNNLDKLF
ncbi:MAG: hypothetical protein ABEK17_00530 [Candidatus Aenigmatarchaeota archaeon]